jgi:rare lipoprotein A
MSPLCPHVFISVIVMFAGIAATSESQAAARDRPVAGATRSSLHHTHRSHTAVDGTVTRRIAGRAARGDTHRVAAGKRAQSSPQFSRNHEASPESGHRFSGMASYYAEGQHLASGAKFDPSGYTCAHPTLPFGTHLRVADPKSGRSVVVTVNDRGPFVRGRALDLSLGAARAIGMIGRGVMRVEAEVI